MSCFIPHFHLSRRWCAVLLGCFVLTGGLPASTVVVDFPLPTSPGEFAAKPADWFTAAPSEWEQPGGRRLDFPLEGMRPEERLVITVIFEDSPGLSIRAWWEPDAPGPALPLAGELAEGLAGWNQRHFLLTSAQAGTPGLLVLESVGSARAIHRVVFSRLEPSPLFVPPTRTDEERYSVGQNVLTEEELSAEPWVMPPDSWSGRRIEAYLQEFPESLRGGVEFAVEIRPAPRWAVLRFEVRLPNFRPPEIWVNGQALPGVSVEIPSLRSPGYIETSVGADLLYAGWRPAWVVIPHGTLVEGENRFMISSGHTEGFVRQARVEMWFHTSLLPSAEDGWVDEALPDIIGENLGELPLEQATDPLLPAWESAEETPAHGSPEANNEPANPPGPSGPSNYPPPADLFRTSFF